MIDDVCVYVCMCCISVYGTLRILFISDFDMPYLFISEVIVVVLVCRLPEPSVKLCTFSADALVYFVNDHSFFIVTYNLSQEEFVGKVSFFSVRSCSVTGGLSL